MNQFVSNNAWWWHNN